MEDINEITKISTKGQLVVPKIIRDDLGLEPGNRIFWKSAKKDERGKKVTFKIEIL